MSAFLIYILKVALLTSVFVLLYHLLFRRDTFFSTARAVLISSLVMSYVLPLCVITVHRPVQIPAEPDSPIVGIPAPAASGTLNISDATVLEPSVPAPFPDSSKLDWVSVTFDLYLAGVLALAIFRLISVRKVKGIISRGRVVQETEGCTVVLSQENVRPFSWMRYIVLPENGPDFSESHEVMCHEMSHFRHHHSQELLFADVLSTFQWFNPAVWLLRHDLSRVHEFQADASVIEVGHDRMQYEQSLLSMSTGGMSIPFVNGLGESSLLERIHMMNRSGSKRSALLKLVYLPALIAVSLALTSNMVYDRRKAPYVLTGGTGDIGYSRIMYEYPDTEYYYQGLRFNIANGVAVVTGYDWETDYREPQRSISIPASIRFEGRECDVRCIARSALAAAQIAEVIIPEGITEIGARAFEHCQSLQSVVIPSTVCLIEPNAFLYCSSLKSVIIENGLESLPDGMFMNCRNLESVRLPSTLKKIGNGAFSDCRHLSDISLPKMLERIGDEAFFRCIRLSSVSLPRRLEYIGTGAFYECRSMEMPDTGELKAEIGENAFYISNN